MITEPLIAPAEQKPRRDVQAGLDAEVLYLIQSGELVEIFRIYPDANTREGAIDRAMRGRLAKRFPREFTGLEVHVQPGLVSFRFEAFKRRDEPEPAAHARIPTRLMFED